MLRIMREMLKPILDAALALRTQLDGALQLDRIVFAEQSAFRKPQSRGIVGEIGLGTAAPLAHELRSRVSSLDRP
jgi:hypothetical protein